MNYDQLKTPPKDQKEDKKREIESKQAWFPRSVESNAVKSDCSGTNFGGFSADRVWPLPET